MEKHNNYCVILAGGVGKRLWPNSRRNKPKQFLDVFGVGKTLLQQTYERVARFILPENIFISTFEEYVGLVNEQLPQVDHNHILAEPVQLSTAPATAWAACHLALINPKANILITPCDQLILDTERYVEQVVNALSFVSTRDVFLSIGVKTTSPNRAYGYIQMGQEVQPNVFEVRSFTEKPDAEYAEKFVESGEFLWNTGLFVWNARAFRKLLHNVMPELEGQILDAIEKLPTIGELELVQKLYPASLHRSIDLVILDKCQDVFVFRCDFGWADIGSWPALHEISEKDVDGNAVVGGGKALFANTQNTIVCLPEGKAAVVRGLDNYLISQKENVIVICPNDDPSLAKRLFKEVEISLGGEYT